MMRSIRQRALDWVAITRLRKRGVPFPPVAPTGGEAQRVLIGPANSAGQGFRWARALEAASPEIKATSMAFIRDQDLFSYAVDQEVPSGYAAHSPQWQRAQREAIMNYSAVLIESAQPLFSRLDGLDTVEQIDQLRSAGVGCGLLFHGSDIRDPEAHLANEANSHFGVDERFRARMDLVTRRSRSVVERTGLPVYVSTPDLLTELSGARWLPVVVDAVAWETNTAPLQHEGVPRVVHAPSNSTVKGTELIDPPLQRLHDNGVIEYRRISGISHHEMRAVYRDADIVVDQFRVGNYGVAACEALAAGRIVVSHVAESVRTRTWELTGQELPIIEATPDTLAGVITTIIDDSAQALHVAAEGPKFVRDWHDGTYSGRVLKSWLEETT